MRRSNGRLPWSACRRDAVPASASLARAGDAPIIHTVLISPKGEVWVTDRAEKKIVVYDQGLKKQREIKGDGAVGNGDSMLTAGPCRKFALKLAPRCGSVAQLLGAIC